GEFVGALSEVGVVLAELTVFLERGAAAGGISNYRVIVAVEEGVDVAPSQLAGQVAQAGVDVEGAATTLVGRQDHFAAVVLKDADGRFVEAGKRHIGQAA